MRTIGDERHFAFSEILGVDVHPSLVGTSYAVRTRRGAIQFTSMLADHERLCRLIVTAAGLSAE